jgi:hypothetical protein
MYVIYLLENEFMTFRAPVNASAVAFDDERLSGTAKGVKK